MTPTNRPRFHPGIGLLLLSALWAIGTLRPELLPNLIPEASALPPLARLFLPCALLACAASAWALLRRHPWPRRKQLWLPFLTGLGLFVFPALLTSVSEYSTNAYTRTVLFTLVPIFCLVLEPHISPTAVSTGRLALPAALAAVFGALCVFPIQLPDSLGTTAAFCASILAAASIAIASCLAANAGDPVSPVAAIAGLTGAAAFALASLIPTPIHNPPIWTWRPTLSTLLWTATIELPALLLLFPILRQLSATHAATRYLFAPLIAILAGAALLQQPLTLRTSLGLLLIAAGAIYLLFAPANPDTGSTPLSLH